MRDIAKLSFQIGLCLVLSVPALASEPVLVFTTSERPVAESQAIKSQTYQLDAANKALRILDSKLPGNFEKAYPELQKRINSPIGKAALSSLDQSYQGVVLAWELGVERLPAIVFDRQFVVYGVISVDKAAQLLKESRR